jgi:hypothetical protein
METCNRSKYWARFVLVAVESVPCCMRLCSELFLNVRIVINMRRKSRVMDGSRPR